jgi:hypothetical protein
MARVTISTTDAQEWERLVNGPWATLFGKSEVYSDGDVRTVAFDVDKKTFQGVEKLPRGLVFLSKLLKK